MSRLAHAVIVALIVLAAATPALAVTVELEPMMDATLYEDAEGDLANGSGSHLFVGRTGQPLARRALLAFDIAGAIPAGSTVTSVGLHIEVSRASDPSAQAVRVHRVTEAWGEGASDAPGEEGSGTAAAPGDATWIHRSYPNDMWITAGGSFVPAASAQQAIGGLGPYSFSSTPELVGDVQSWLDDPSGNFGWILVMEGSAAHTAKRFSSRENAEAASRPRLEIEYQTGGGSLDTLYYLPAAAKSAGAQGSFFVTDLDIQNGDADPASYQLLWLPRGADNSTPDASAIFTLDPGAAVRYRDVLGAVFDFDDGAVGALAILAASSDLTLMSRTYNAPPAGGTFGQAIPGYRSDQLIGEGERRRILFFTENGEFRSNLGLLNGTGDPIVIMWERFLPDGASLGTGQADLPPWGNVQLNRVFADSQPVEAAFIEVWTTTTGGAFAAYGSVLDNQSSDPTTVLPQ
jgi:hypothetical protein